MSIGLQFKKVDLHIHTPASNCFIKKDITPEQLVQEAIQKGLDAIAITDHNTGEFIDRIKKASAGTSLTIFPGVEITVSEGFHIIALFDVNKGTAEIESLLAALDITPDYLGKTDALCTYGAHKVVDKIIERKGLALLAHVDEPRGSYNELNGSIRVRFFNEAPYTAIETSTGKLPADFTSGKGFKRFPACYQASDNPDSNEPKKHSIEGMGTKYSNFKLDKEIDIEGLRQCFADPDVRIRAMGSVCEVEFPKILSLEASDGFLKYQNLRFHQGLNSIIGGKGVGKSLIIEFLRFALDQSSNNKDISLDLKGKLEKRLGISNHVKVVFEMPSGTQYRVIRNLDGSHECINLETEEPYCGRIADLFPILAYSQTEVIKISEDEEAQLKLIDSFIDTRPHLDRIAGLNNLLKINDDLLSKAIKANSELESFQKDVNTLDGQIAEINKLFTGTPEELSLLVEFKKLENKKLVFQSHQNYLSSLRQIVFDAHKKIENMLPLSLTAEQEGDKELSLIYQKSVDEQSSLSSILASLIASIDQANDNTKEIFTGWYPYFEAREKEYDSAIEREKGKKSLESQRKSLNEQHEILQAKVSEIKSVADSLNELRTQRNALLDDLDNAYKDYFEARKHMFDTLTEKSAGKLQLQLNHAEKKDKFQQELKALVKGSGARTVDIESIVKSLTPRYFIDLVCARNTGALVDETEISDNSSQVIVNKLWSEETVKNVLALQHTCYPEDVPTIMFRKNDEEYAPLNELSVGQKCTALLIIALSEGSRPVIIDQPEDALDITTVWEDVSMKLRKTKEKRQFILTTHNASVAVSSDSDMFIVVNSNSKQANVKCLGAIENKNVKDAVIQHLEGGEEPYQLRRKKYNFNL